MLTRWAVSRSSLSFPPPSSSLSLLLSFHLLPFQCWACVHFLHPSLQIILRVKKIFEALSTLVDVSIPKVSVTSSSSLLSYLTLFSSPSAPYIPLSPFLAIFTLPPPLPPSPSATGLQCVEIFTDNFTIFSTSSNSMAIPQKTTPTYPSNHDKQWEEIVHSKPGNLLTVESLCRICSSKASDTRPSTHLPS